MTRSAARAGQHLALLGMAALVALSGGIALADLPVGEETTSLAVQNAGASPAEVLVKYFERDGSLVPAATHNVAGIPPGGAAVVPGLGDPNLPPSFNGYASPSSGQPLASLLVREITANTATDNHSYSIITVRSQGAPRVALPILLSDFSGEHWTSRFTVLNVGSEPACLRISYFIAASLGSAAVGQKVVDSPTGQQGCASGYRLPPNGVLMFGDAAGASFPYPPSILATQSAGLIEVLNASGDNDIVAGVDIYRSDGNRLLGSYDGFAVRQSAPTTDDVGTEVVMPLAIKHVSGYYSVVGVQNLGPVPTDVRIRYRGSTESGTPVDVTVTIPSVANVGFHSTYDESTPIPIDFVGYAAVTSQQPVAAVLIRGKQTRYLSGTNEPTYTAVNGVPRDRGDTQWSLPLIYRRVQPLTSAHIGWNSWIQVQVADGSTANVTLRLVGSPGSGCSVGPFTTTVPVAGSKVFYMNAEIDNGFPAGQAPACFLGAATVTSTKPVIVIANVSSDSFPGGDNEALYNAVPAKSYSDRVIPKPPAAPSGVKAELLAFNSSSCTVTIRATWSDNATAESGFIVGPPTSAIVGFAGFARVSPNVTTATFSYTFGGGGIFPVFVFAYIDAGGDRIWSEPSGLMLTVPACDSPPAPGQGVVTVRSVDFESWDPHFSDFSQDADHFYKVWRGLYQFDAAEKPQPSMAAGMPTVSADGKTYTVKLKPGIKWSDGQPLTAEDFVLGLQRSCNFKIASHYQYILRNVVGCNAYYDARSNASKSPAEIEALRQALGVRAVDASTIEYRLTEPQPTFTIILAMWPTFPVPKHKVATVDAAWPGPMENVYNGPFMPAVYRAGSWMELVANPNWAGAEKPKVEKIVVRYIDDTSVAETAYRAGELDITAANTSTLEATRNDPTLSKELLSYASPTTIGLEFQLMDPLMAKADVRIALSQATDRKALNDIVLKGANIPTTAWIPYALSGAEEGAYDGAIGFDVTKAKASLAKAGYPNGQGFPGVTILLTDSASNKGLGEFLQSEWKKNLNIDVKLEFTDSKTRSVRFNSRDFQVVTGGWHQDYGDVENWMLGLWETGGSINKTNTSDPKIDALIMQAKFNQNPEQRVSQYRDAEKLLLETAQGIAPLYFRANWFLVKPYIKGVIENANGNDSQMPAAWLPELWSTSRR